MLKFAKVVTKVLILTEKKQTLNVYHMQSYKKSCQDKKNSCFLFYMIRRGMLRGLDPDNYCKHYKWMRQMMT